MFIHENENMVILANTRCGHTSMYEYFGIEPYSKKCKLLDWMFSDKRKILVLRNPKDRIMSAHKNNQLFIGTDIDLEQSFIAHSSPYLGHLLHLDFEFISFERLHEYIPMSHRTVTVSKIPYQYIPNRKYTEAEVKHEMNSYKIILNTKSEINPEEWKAITT